MLSVEGTLI